MVNVIMKNQNSAGTFTVVGPATATAGGFFAFL